MNALSSAADVTVLAIGALTVLGAVQLVRRARTSAGVLPLGRPVPLMIGLFVALVALPTAVLDDLGAGP